jgi:hypothetical protein
MQGASAMIKEEVDSEDIADVVSRWTGIPVSKMMQPMALEQPDTVASLTKHEMPTIEIDNEWIEDLSWRNRFENEHLQRLAVESPWLVPNYLSLVKPAPSAD